MPYFVRYIVFAASVRNLDYNFLSTAQLANRSRP